MCEHCGCQGIPAIEVLTREHDEALDHIRTASQAMGAADDPAIQRACSRLAALLRPHTQVEEQALFPALRAEFPQQIAVLVGEHRRFERTLAEAADPAARSTGWQELLTTALEDLRHHIQKEQDGVFPAALSILTPSQWDQLERVRRGAPTQSASA